MLKNLQRIWQYPAAVIILAILMLSVQGIEHDSKKYRYDIVPEKMSLEEKKQRFLHLVLPPVQRVFEELNQRYQKISRHVRVGKSTAEIERLKKEYYATSNSDLLERLKPHPVSVVIAQAAIESGWATSRLFVKARNLFGVWSFNKDEPRIAAAELRGSKTIWLRKYYSIEAAVRDNYKILSTGAAFKKFRKLRAKTENPFEIVKGLDKYSELGGKYGKKLAQVIRYNKFDQYDRNIKAN